MTGNRPLRWVRLLSAAREFFKVRLWEPDLDQLSPVQAFAYRQLRVATLLFDGLIKGRLALRASAMTFTTLLSAVPLLVVVFATIRALGGFSGVEQRLEEYLLDRIVPESQAEVRQWLFRFFESVRDGAFSGITVLALLGGGLGLLGSIEGAFNEIWAVRRPRPLFHRFTTYITLIALGPILVGVSLSMTASLESASFWTLIEQRFPELTLLIGIGFKIAPILLTGVALTLLYTILPNTRVRLSAAFPAGMTAAFLFEASKAAYSAYIHSATNYNALYGSIAAVPIFVVWVHVSWLVVLFGAELTFARDAARDLRDEELALGASEREKLRVAFHLALEAARCYRAGKPPTSLGALARAVDLPVRLVLSVADELSEGGLFHTVHTTHRNPGLVPARPPENITVHEVVACLLDRGSKLGARDPGTPAARAVESLMREWEADLRDPWERISLSELLEREEQQPGTVVPFPGSGNKPPRRNK